MLPGALNADDCTFTDGSRLQGTLLALDPGGWITLQSPNSTTPLQLKTSALQRVEFTRPPASLSEQDSRVRLRNGDSFPAEILSLDDKALQVKTWFAGEIKIPREAMEAVDFGVSNRNQVPGGQLTEGGWEGEGWEFREGQWHSGEANQTLSRKIPLPAQYRVRFRVKWDNSPNLKLFFASSSSTIMGGSLSAYCIIMNHEGLEVKRHNLRESGPPHVTLNATEDLRFDSDDEHAEVELRVDSKQRLMSLYLNGHLLRRFPDAAANPPNGDFVVLQNLAREHGQQTIESFEITTWDSRSEKFRDTPRGDTSKDLLLDDEGNIYSGKVASITGTAQNALIAFSHPHAEGGEIRMPTRRASTLYFRQSAEAEKDASPFNLQLRLTPEGSLHATSCQMSNGQWQCTHPLLGSLKIDPRAILLLEPAPKNTP